MGSGMKRASNLKKIRLAVPCSCLATNGGSDQGPLLGRQVWICAKRWKKVTLPGPMVATHVSSHHWKLLGMLLDESTLKQGCKKAWYER